jgi:hypothetical protein
VSASPVDLAVTVLRGNLYLSRELYEHYFCGIEQVALMERDGEVLVVPLLHSPGGLLLKMRNAHGDRVIQAQEFLRGLGFPEDFTERSYAVQWRSDLAALVLLSAK